MLLSISLPEAVGPFELQLRTFTVKSRNLDLLVLSGIIRQRTVDLVSYKK